MSHEIEKLEIVLLVIVAKRRNPRRFQMIEVGVEHIEAKETHFWLGYAIPPRQWTLIKARA